ncbi:MAG: hypothetical protein EVA89_31070, partial [Sandaracinaceae bacterium]
MRPQFSSSHLFLSLLLLTGCDATPGRVGVVGPAPSDAAPPARDAGPDAAPTRDAGRRPPPDASEPDAGP